MPSPFARFYAAPALHKFTREEIALAVLDCGPDATVRNVRAQCQWALDLEEESEAREAAAMDACAH